MRREKSTRLQRTQGYAAGKLIDPEHLPGVLREILRPGDTVILEGCNQKQASALARGLAGLEPERIHDLHMVMPVVQMAEHLELFEKGIASTLDFSYGGRQSQALYRMAKEKKVQIRGMYTFLELYGRLMTDLEANVALCAAEMADEAGNLYTGCNTEDTPVLVEAVAARGGIVLVQVDKIVKSLPRVDIPGDWVDLVLRGAEPCELEAPMTVDPARIKDEHILMAMMTLKGVYGRHQVNRLNHGVGMATAALELILPTFGRRLDLRGRICQYWVGNIVPTMIPALEDGWIKRVYSFGCEPGMDGYVNAHPEIFPTGIDGTLRPNSCFCHAAGLYGIDAFTGSSLQIDWDGNAGTVVAGRAVGYGGGPNYGSPAAGRRHAYGAWNSMAEGVPGTLRRGRKLLVQIMKTQSSRGPNIVERLDAETVQKEIGLDLPPVMFYEDEITHLVTEKGIAYLHRARDREERRRLIAAVAGDTPLGQTMTRGERDALRLAEKVALPGDLGIDPARATRELLAAQSLEDLENQSRGLYRGR